MTRMISVTLTGVSELGVAILRIAADALAVDQARARFALCGGSTMVGKRPVQSLPLRVSNRTPRSCGERIRPIGCATVGQGGHVHVPRGQDNATVSHGLQDLV